MNVSTCFPVLASLNICPLLVYSWLEFAIEAERAKLEAQRILKSPEACDSYENVLQGERLLCFMRRGIRSDKLTPE